MTDDEIEERLTGLSPARLSGLLEELLRGGALTDGQWQEFGELQARRELERTASMLAGYQLSFWLPTTLVRKVLMFLFLALGVIGAFHWSPWFGLFVLLGCSFSPRIVGEISLFIGKLSQ